MLYRFLQNHTTCKDCLQIATLVKFKCCLRESLPLEIRLKEGDQKFVKSSLVHTLLREIRDRHRYRIISQVDSIVCWYFEDFQSSIFKSFRLFWCFWLIWSFLTFLFLKWRSTTEQTELLLQTSAGRQKLKYFTEHWALRCQLTGLRWPGLRSKQKSEISRQN